MQLRRNKDGTVWIEREDPEFERSLESQGYVRIPGRLRWLPPKGTIEKVIEFVRTVTSGRVSDEVLQGRLEVCEACPMLVREAGGAKFCGGCSCGRWALARLDGTILPKLGFVDTRCPLKRW